MKPLSKFLLVKVVVFGFWWQSVCLESMGSFGWFDSLEASSDAFTPGTSADDFSTSVFLQDLLITAEVVAIAIFYHYTFSLADVQRVSMVAALLQHDLALKKRVMQEWHAARTSVGGVEGGNGESDGDPGDAVRSHSPTGGRVTTTGAAPFKRFAAQLTSPLGSRGSSTRLADLGVGTETPELGAIRDQDSVRTALIDTLMLDVISDSANVVRAAGAATISAVEDAARIVRSAVGGVGASSPSDR